MVGVNHVYVVEIDGRRLIGNVHGVVQREIPDREGLELGVARADAALVLVVKLAQAGRHFSAAGPRRGDDDERTARFDVVVSAEALVAHDERNVGGVVGNDVVAVDADAELLQTLLEFLRRALGAKMRDDNAANIQPAALERVDETQSVVVIGDAEVAAALAALNVVGRDRNDDLGVVLHLHEHAHLAVRLEAGEHARGMVIVKELAAKLQIQLAAEVFDPLADLLRLHLHVLVVIKSQLLHDKLL